jgi:subtilisin-like proprotein convertase family protein
MKGIFTTLALFLALTSFSQATWVKFDKNQLPVLPYNEFSNIPYKYEAFTLSINDLRTKLASAPKEVDFIGSRTNMTIKLPMPNGTQAEFVMWESTIMEDGLAKKFPNIKSYKGYQKDNKLNVTRITMTSDKFYAAVITDHGTVYVDPYANANVDNRYISYYTIDDVAEKNANMLLCGTDDSAMHAYRSKLPKWGTQNRSTGTTTELRTYRLALSCAGEWGSARGTKEKAMEEMVAFVDRANLVFEKEISLRLVFIEDNDKLIFLNGLTDPYATPTQGLETVGDGSVILNNLVGFDNYEVGHIFLPCNDIGGVAAGAICTPGKGNGVTCYGGVGVNNGTISIFNHEVAHQMTASHTWNHCVNPQSDGQLAPNTAFEPGSGSTIMSYAGACGTSNLNVPEDKYYHSASLQQIFEFTNTDGSPAYECAKKIDVGNTNPKIKIITPADMTIPAKTPFYLLGSGTDAENDPMTFIWEQIDANPSVPLGEPFGGCPLFRSFRSTSNPIRLFPNQINIFNKVWDDNKELLPTYTRNMNFRFTIRDNNPMAPAVAMSDIKFKVSGNAGPFIVTTPDVADTKYIAGQTYPITWDVANTDKAPVNAEYVDIFLAYGNTLDFGSTNVVQLVSKTPNDGSYDLKIPAKTSNSGRIIVRGHNSIFFAVSAKISVQEAVASGHYSNIVEVSKSACLPSPVEFDITTSAIAGLTDKINFVLEGTPPGAIASFEKQEVSPGESNKITFNLENVVGDSTYLLVLKTIVPGKDTLSREFYIITKGTDLSNIQHKSPAVDAAGVGPTQKYEWIRKPDADTYYLEVATKPQFAPEDIVISHTTKEVFFLSEKYLEKSTIYYWRVKSSNTCGEGQWSKVKAFTTAALLCNTTQTDNVNIAISGTGTPSIEVQLDVAQVGVINDINISNINITHTNTKDLVVSLLSPKGTKATLWSKKCNSQNVNVGVDQESAFFFACPINTGRTYRPESSLAVFNGEPMQGRWILKVDDTEAGNSGRFNSWKIEMCANIALVAPKLVRNNVLQIYPKNKRPIDRVLLLAEDENSQPADLTYTLVNTPSKGSLVLNNAPLTAGSTFTQDDIDKYVLEYIHSADDEEDDSFSFVISDGQGGYVLVNDFTIEVDRSFPSKTKDLTNFEQQVLVFPNPTQDFINVQLLSSKTSSSWTLSLLDINGKIVSETSVNHKTARISLEDLPNGIYLAKITVDGKSTIKKVMKS